MIRFRNVSFNLHLQILRNIRNVNKNSIDTCNYTSNISAAVFMH